MHRLTHSILPLLLILGAGLIFSACEYEPEGTHFVEIPLVVPEVHGVYLDPADSIVYVEKYTDFQFSFNFGVQEVLLIEFYLDGFLVETFESNSGVVSCIFLPGVHRVDVIVYTSTASGSVADRFNSEAYVYEWTWKAILEETPEQDFGITSLEKVNGQLQVNWTAEPVIAFESFEVWKTTPEGSALLATITDENQRTCIDETFIGGDASYSLVMKREDRPGLFSDTLVAPHSSYQLQVEETEGDSLILHWDACDFPGNLDRYVVWVSNDGDDPVLWKEISDANDTSCVVDIEFLRYGVFAVEYWPAGEDGSSGVLTAETQHAMILVEPKPIFDYRKVTQPLFSPYFVHTDDRYFDPATGGWENLQVNETQKILEASPDGRYVLAGSFLWRWVGGTLVEQRRLLNIPGEFFNQSGLQASLSLDGGFAYFELGDRSLIYQTEMDLIYLEFPSGKHHGGGLSPNGGWIYWFDESRTTLSFFSRESSGETIAEIHPCSTPPVYINERYFFVQVEDVVEYWDGHLWTREASYENLQGRLLAFDPVSETLLTYESGVVHVYDVTDLSQVYELWVGESYHLETEHMAYVNKTLIVHNLSGSAAEFKLDF
ncbi:MAG: hypothetical protein R2751_19095 [Bacteroidales bacterium]